MASAIPARNIRLKRAYESPARGDGVRVLVDRLWPRGLSKQKAALDRWMKEIAPSSALREWFGHRAERWVGFQKRYAEELHEHNDLLSELRAVARDGPLTLVYAARDEDHNEAVVLRRILLRRDAASSLGQGGA